MACELVAALRAVRMGAIRTGAVRLTAAQSRAVELCAGLPAGVQDRDLTADLEAAQRLVPALAELVEPYCAG